MGSELVLVFDVGVGASACSAMSSGASSVTVEVYGNVFAATSFLQGVAVEEVDWAKLGFFDEAYPVIVGIRARKAEDA